MDERSGDFAAHPLAQAELARGRAHQFAYLEYLNQVIHALLVFVLIEFIDARQEVEGVERRQVYPKLRLLPEDGGDVVGQLLAILPWREAEHAGLPARWIKDTGKYLDGGGLARAVRPDECQQFA